MTKKISKKLCEIRALSMLCRLLRPADIDEELKAIREERERAENIQRETIATLNGEVDWFMKGKRKHPHKESKNG